MIVGVADTHAALWYLSNDPRFIGSAGNFLDQASSSGCQVGISSISLAELVYLIEKKRLPAYVYSDVEADMPDRIIAATAVSLQVPIISRDGYIRASALQTIW